MILSSIDVLYELSFSYRQAHVGIRGFEELLKVLGFSVHARLAKELKSVLHNYYEMSFCGTYAPEL